MNLCPRHRYAVMNHTRQAGRDKILAYVKENPASCPYCLLWSDMRKRGKKK